MCVWLQIDFLLARRYWSIHHEKKKYSFPLHPKGFSFIIELNDPYFLSSVRYKLFLKENFIFV